MRRNIKIYKRKSLVVGVKTINKEKKRKRSEIVNFRVTQQEKVLLEERIKLSGLHKQDFFIGSCLHQKIITFGNIRTFDEMRKQLEIIDNHLCSIEKADELDYEILESLRAILELFDGLNDDKKIL